MHPERLRWVKQQLREIDADIGYASKGANFADALADLRARREMLLAELAQHEAEESEG